MSQGVINVEMILNREDRLKNLRLMAEVGQEHRWAKVHPETLMWLLDEVQRLERENDDLRAACDEMAREDESA